MPRLCFRLRTLMILVAVCGCLLSACFWIERRRIHFQSLAVFHYRKIEAVTAAAHDADENYTYFMTESDVHGKRLTTTQLARSRWHLRMQIKYREASPDQPERRGHLQVFSQR